MGDGGRDVDLARWRVGDGAARDAGAGEDEGRAGLDDVEGAVLSRLSAEGVGLGVDGDVGGVGAVEELGDALVGEGVGVVLGLDKGAVGVVVGETGGACGGELIIDGGERLAVLVGDGVFADLLDDAVVVAATAGGVEALEADHAALRPDLVGGVAVGDDQVGLGAGLAVGQESDDRAVTGFVLFGVEALAAEALGEDGGVDAFAGGGHGRLRERGEVGGGIIGHGGWWCNRAVREKCSTRVGRQGLVGGVVSSGCSRSCGRCSSPR